MMIKHGGGHDPVFNVEIVFTDKDKQAEMQQKSSATPEDVEAMARTLEFSEIDYIEGVWAKQFFWPVVYSDHQSYEVMIASRSGSFSETIQTQRNPQGEWSDRIKVVNAQTKKTLINCRDTKFEESDSMPLPKCFPQYVLGDEAPSATKNN